MTRVELVLSALSRTEWRPYRANAPDTDEGVYRRGALYQQVRLGIVEKKADPNAFGRCKWLYRLTGKQRRKKGRPKAA